jgi:citrate lyase beta subunit
MTSVTTGNLVSDMRTRDRPRRRTTLLVPLVSRQVLRWASTIDADEVVLDLEAIPVSEKNDFLRVALAESVTRGGWRANTIAVQINLHGTRWFEEDLIQLVMLAAFGIDSMVVPAVNCTEDVRAASELLDEIEFEFPVENPLSLQARIGSPAGLAVVEDITKVSPRLQALVFDSTAYTQAVGAPAEEDYPGDRWHYPRSRIVAAAQLAGVAAIDGPAPHEQDIELTRVQARWSRAVGYAGKWATSPQQLPVLASVFG